jgi:hypothetical protein
VSIGCISANQLPDIASALLLLQIPEPVEEACSVPHYFICPITHSIMLEPAVTSSGATYERSAIMEWLRAQK